MIYHENEKINWKPFKNVCKITITYKKIDEFVLQSLSKTIIDPTDHSVHDSNDGKVFKIFLPCIPVLYPLKTSGNVPGDFRGYKMGI